MPYTDFILFCLYTCGVLIALMCVVLRVIITLAIPWTWIRFLDAKQPNHRLRIINALATLVLLYVLMPTTFQGKTIIELHPVVAALYIPCLMAIVHEFCAALYGSNLIPALKTHKQYVRALYLIGGFSVYLSTLLPYVLVLFNVIE